nr:hypothetical protein [Tanacetum cinerariifolium]
SCRPMRNKDYASWDLGQMHMGRSGLGEGTVPANFDILLCYLAIRVRSCRSMRNKDYASWDLGQMHMGRSGLGEGTVLVSCRNPPIVNTGATQRGNVCFACGAQGHFRRECPKLKNNNNRGNQVGNAKTQEKVYAVGKAGANPDNNVVTGTFLLNKHYASILFDTGADRSFVSTAFSSRIIITPTTLDHDYNVELADRRIVGLNNIIRVPCCYNLCKKIVRIPFGNEILIVRGDESSKKHETRLNIISYTKTQEYLSKGCHVFLANITATKDEDKSKGKRLKDLPIVQEFLEVFPEDLPSIPPTRQVEF